MEQMNRLEIKGVVGNIKVTPFGNTSVARLSVATDYCFKTKDGSAVIETTWHSVSAWQGSNDIESFDKIQRGTHVHIIGRLRQQRYTDAQGVDRSVYEVVATKLEVMSE